MTTQESEEGMEQPAPSLQLKMVDRVERLSTADRVLGISSILLLAMMFTEAWLHGGEICGTYGGVTTCTTDAGFYSNGFNGWGWLTFLSLVAVMALFLARNFFYDLITLPRMPFSDGQLYMGLGAVQLLGLALFWLQYDGDPVGFGWAWVIALIAAAGTTLSGYMKQQESLLASGLVAGPE